jgi:hypothetical protein
MAQISIADDLLGKVDTARSETVSAEEFVADAVRERLAWHDRKTEFFQLSDEIRRTMDAKEITEAEILVDFEASRESPI